MTLFRSLGESISRKTPRLGGVATTAQGDGRVIADVAVYDVLEPVAEHAGRGIAAEEAEGVDGGLAEFGFSSSLAASSCLDRAGGLRVGRRVGPRASPG